MPTQIEETAPCRKKLRVEIDSTRADKTRAEIATEFRKAARIPGFRPGKAPEAMVERRYAKEIDEELRKKLIPVSYQEALKEHSLNVVGYPQIESVEYEVGAPFVFTALVDTTPDFELPEYKGIPLRDKEVTVTDDQITETLETLRDQQADFQDVEGRALQSGDFAVLNYSGTAEGTPVAELVPQSKTLGENENAWVLIESKSFLPGFCDQLVGATVGEKRQVQVDFPDDFPHETLSGKKATYFVDVVAIKEKNLSPLDDEFAKKVGAETLDQLQNDIREGLTRQHEQERDADLRKQVADYLLEQVSFDLPESLVEQETRSIVYDVVRENSMRGASKEMLEEKRDEIFGVANKSARDRLRVSFMIEAIGKKESIEVAPEEMEERIMRLAQQQRITPDRLKAQLSERNALGEIEEQVLVSKTLDFLISNAKVSSAKETK